MSVVNTPNKTNYFNIGSNTLTVMAIVLIVILWLVQVAYLIFSSEMVSSHAEVDSEVGTMGWLLMGLASQFILLGWQSMPIALSASSLFIRCSHQLEIKRFHKIVFWLSIASFILSLAWILIAIPLYF